MSRFSRDLFFICIGQIFFTVFCIASFQMFKINLFLFAPLIFAILAIAIIPPRLSIGLALGYMVFDGMLKILSG